MGTTVDGVGLLISSIKIVYRMFTSFPEVKQRLQNLGLSPDVVNDVLDAVSAFIDAMVVADNYFAQYDADDTTEQKDNS